MSQPPSVASAAAQGASTAGLAAGGPPSAESKTTGRPDSEGRATDHSAPGPRARPANGPIASSAVTAAAGPAAPTWTTRTRPTPASLAFSIASSPARARIKGGTPFCPSKTTVPVISAVTFPSAEGSTCRVSRRSSHPASVAMPKGAAPAASNQSRCRWPSAEAPPSPGPIARPPRRRSEPPQVVKSVTRSLRGHAEARSGPERIRRPYSIGPNGGGQTLVAEMGGVY